MSDESHNIALAESTLKPEGACGSTTVVMHHGGHVSRLKCYPGETLLETARRGHVPLNSNCERGECGTCMVTVLSGAVKMRANQVLSDADVKDGLTLACQSLPLSEVVEIELP